MSDNVIEPDCTILPPPTTEPTTEPEPAPGINPIAWVEACPPGDSRTACVGHLRFTVDRRPIAISQNVGGGGDPVINFHGVDPARTTEEA